MGKKLVTGVLIRGTWLMVAAVALVFAGVSVASAYQESTTSVDPADTPEWQCPACHGLESGETSPAVSQSRRGPHAGFEDGSAKCSVCHTSHYADPESVLVLAAPTVSDSCLICHDGTGGGGVYGVIERQVPGATPSTHRIGLSLEGSVAVPGGAPDGSTIGVVFSESDGALGCIDCHSVHGADTVEPFVGDRLRSVADTTSDIASDRLLRVAPGSLDATATQYGSDWCEACHKGLAAGMMNHPVAASSSATPAVYASVHRMAGYDTDEVAATKGPLGGSNLGYMVPAGSGGIPICQQCHEDARVIGDSVLGSIASSEAFSPSADGVSGGNPAFQNFPHESLNATMLIEPRASLCLNCHSTVGEGPVH